MVCPLAYSSDLTHIRASFNDSCCKVNNITCRWMYFSYFSLFLIQPVQIPTLYLCFNPFNSALLSWRLIHPKYCSCCCFVFIRATSFTLFIFDQWHFTFYDLKLFHEMIRKKYKFILLLATRIDEVFRPIFPLLRRSIEKLNSFLKYCFSWWWQFYLNKDQNSRKLVIAW